MNNKRLSTFSSKNLEGNIEIPQSLIDEVLNMKYIYVKDPDGLRKNASNQKLVVGQLFYILASGFDGNHIIFKDSSEYAKYFNVSSATINNKLTKKTIIRNLNNIEFILSRKPL
jgi:hypothetical protein